MRIAASVVALCTIIGVSFWSWSTWQWIPRTDVVEELEQISSRVVRAKWMLLNSKGVFESHEVAKQDLDALLEALRHAHELRSVTVGRQKMESLKTPKDYLDLLDVSGTIVLTVDVARSGKCDRATVESLWGSAFAELYERAVKESGIEPFAVDASSEGKGDLSVR